MKKHICLVLLTITSLFTPISVFGEDLFDNFDGYTSASTSFASNNESKVVGVVDKSMHERMNGKNIQHT